MLMSRRNLMIGGATAGAALAASPAFARPLAGGANPAAMFGPEPGVALLSRNENPYGPSPRALEAIDAASKKGAYYAERANGILTAMIAERYGITPKQVVIGTGSGEVLNAIAMAWKPAGAYLAPELFWDSTARWGVRQGGTLKTVPLTADMDMDLPAMAAAVDDSIGLVHLVNPNNPTGLLTDGDVLRGFIKQVAPKKTILIDEAYNELVEKPEYSSMIDMVKAGHDVIVTRTFSKIYGLAGMRVGYSISSEANAEKIRKSMMASTNCAGLAAAIASYDDFAFQSYSKGKITEARQMIGAAVKTSGLTALPASANFVFVKVADAKAVQQGMEVKDVLIRGPYGKWTTWSRVSTGMLPDVERYCKALPEVVGA